MKIKHVFILIFIVFLSGCGTKRQYFKPDSVVGEFEYTNKLSSNIKTASKYAATLKNGQIIGPYGKYDIKIDDDFVFLGEFDEKLIIANNEGDLKIYDEKQNLLYEKSFPNLIAAASIKNNILATIDSQNTIYLIDTNLDKILFSNKNENVYALNNRIAAPLFLENLVIFPTLDGKLIVTNDYQQTQDMVLSSEKFFNNIIFLDVVDGKMVAATNKRAIAIQDQKSAFYDDDIKEVAITNEFIYIFTSDGQVKQFDYDFKLINEKKFLFAQFLATTINGDIWAVEKNGFLIKLSFDLQNVEVFSLPSKIKELIFLGKDKLYIKNRIINFIHM